MDNISFIIASLNTLYDKLIDALEYEHGVQCNDSNQNIKQAESLDSLNILRHRFDDWHQRLNFLSTQASAVEKDRSLNLAVKSEEVNGNNFQWRTLETQKLLSKLKAFLAER